MLGMWVDALVEGVVQNEAWVKFSFGARKKFCSFVAFLALAFLSFVKLLLCCFDDVRTKVYSRLGRDTDNVAVLTKLLYNSTLKIH